MTDARATSIAALLARRSSAASAASSSAGLRSGARRCGFPECTKTAKPGGLCISHGGGKKCSVDGCTTSVVSRGFCVAHGGGKRCQSEGCTKSAQTGGFCWIHGGGKKCGFEGCVKRAQSGGACISHGGGKRCRMDGCNKVVQYEGLCVGHGGYRKCLSMNCAKKALPSGYCTQHGGNTKCQSDDCVKKAVQGGLCGEHRGLASPPPVLSRSSSVGSVVDSPVLRRAVSSVKGTANDGPTISPTMPELVPTQPARDWSRAIAEARRDLMRNGSGWKRSSSTDDPMAYIRPSMSGRSHPLPTVSELQHSYARDPSLSPLPYVPPRPQATLLDRIAPLLTAVDKISTTNSPSKTADSSSGCHGCVVTGCSRFAKVGGLCLLHLNNTGRRSRPTGTHPSLSTRLTAYTSRQDSQ